MGDLSSIPGWGRSPGERKSCPLLYSWAALCSAGEGSTCRAGDSGSIPGWGRSPGEGKGCPLEYYGLENSMDYIGRGVAKSRTRLSDFHFVLDQASHLTEPKVRRPGNYLTFTGGVPESCDKGHRRRQEWRVGSGTKYTSSCTCRSVVSDSATP